MLGGVLNNLGFLQQQLGDLESAAATYSEAITAQSLAVQLAPEVKRYSQYLCKHQENQRTIAGSFHQTQLDSVRSPPGTESTEDATRLMGASL